MKTYKPSELQQLLKSQEVQLPPESKKAKKRKVPADKHKRVDNATQTGADVGGANASNSSFPALA